MRFELGRLLATPACIRFCEQHGVDLIDLVRRHHSGDWGDLEAEDKRANEDALQSGARVFSSYRVGDDRVWIITNAADDAGNRDATTAMIPSDY